MHAEKKACLLTAFVVIFWATIASAFKIALRVVEPDVLLLYSIFFSACALFAVLCLQGQVGQLCHISRFDLARGALLGCLNPFLYYIVLFKAYELLPGQIAMALNYGWPLALTLFSAAFLKQSLTRVQLLAVLISFFGVVIIATRGQFVGFGDISQVGVLLAVGSTVIFAGFWVLNTAAGKKEENRKQNEKSLTPVANLFLCFCFGFIFSLLYNVLTESFTVPGRSAWLPIIYIALFEMSITFVLWLTALRLTNSAARLSSMVYTTPFFSLLLLSLIIGEQIHISTFAGLLLIIGSILFQEMARRRQRLCQ